MKRSLLAVLLVAASAVWAEPFEFDLEFEGSVLCVFCSPEHQGIQSFDVTGRVSNIAITWNLDDGKEISQFSGPVDVFFSNDVSGGLFQAYDDFSVRGAGFRLFYLRDCTATVFDVDTGPEAITDLSQFRPHCFPGPEIVIEVPGMSAMEGGFRSLRQASAAVPEPSAIALLAAGMAGLGVARTRRRRS